MTSYQPLIEQNVERTPWVHQLTAPSLQEWTAAHQIGNATQRRVQLALLHDRLAASRMGPWKAAFFVRRHAIAFVLRWVLLGTAAVWLTPWAWVAILGIPAMGLYRLLRHG